MKEALADLLATEQFDEVIARCDALQETGGLGAEEAFYYGVSLLRTGAPARAIAALKSATSDSRFGYWGYFWCGLAYQELGQYLEASDAHANANLVSFNPENVAALVRNSLSYLGEADASAINRVRVARRLQDVLVRQHAEAVEAETKLRIGVLESLVREVSLQLRSSEERIRDQDLYWRGGVESWPEPYNLETSSPIAFESADHTHPRGTATDNSRHPRFVAACERHFQRALKALDLGCGGGGLVRDFLIRGHAAMGLEGSDYSEKSQRAEWRVLGGRLRTCDILEPFRISDSQGQSIEFDVITAWEVLEHLPREKLPTFFENVRTHLGRDGLFVASVAQFEDKDPLTGVAWHVTLEARSWWEDMMRRSGLTPIMSPFDVSDYVRGSGTSPTDWDVRVQPEMGFHIVASRSV